MEELDNTLVPIVDFAEETAEIIDRAEVDAVLTALSDLIARVQSPTIRDYLETTCEDIAYLVEEEILAAEADSAEAA